MQELRQKLITPVVIDGLHLRWFVPPELRETVRWGLAWNSDSPRRWAALEPTWSLTADVRSSSKPLLRRLTADPKIDVLQQPSIGYIGALQFMFNADLPVPSQVAVSGPLNLVAGTPRKNVNTRQVWTDFDSDAITVGLVRRLRLVSIVSDMLPNARPPHGSNWGWASRQFVSGTERVYELAHPPEALASYQLTDRVNGPHRESFLVVDLETDP
ncbi:hypothetical protein [Rhodococcus sp. IEGM 1379]|uniref:hypothetical protein n=1 Tax=Rhodococcus sp. IEGM 1379 TaxID=3047086 RepID=UPI0024B667E0|nr:hypothetical protein [Rhodococcus sp. IEGM 1379]MDI9915828.1 hypothetical protein [Rhodococcus sp. IEGM 1379]